MGKELKVEVDDGVVAAQLEAGEIRRAAKHKHNDGNGEPRAFQFSPPLKHHEINGAYNENVEQ